MSVVWRLHSMLRSTRTGRDRLPSVLSVVAFAVATAALLVTGSGVLAFSRRAELAPAGQADGSTASLYLILAITAAALLVVPILTLSAVAARLSLARRDQRLAALRLAGATSGQVSQLTLIDSGSQALLGALTGVAGYLALWPALARVSFDGRELGLTDLWLGIGPLAGAVAAVVLLALGSAATTLATVRVSPLGVAQRVTPGALSALRVAAAVLVGIGWISATQLAGQLGIGILLVLLAGLVMTVNLVGPYVVMLAARLVARRARTATTLLAARRVVDDPKTTWRYVGSLSIGVVIAAVAGGMSAVMTASPAPDAPYLGADVVTGSIIALTVIGLVAATSSGVVLAARVFDQAPVLRSLAMAGVLPTELERARRREVLGPLAVGIGLAAACGLLLMVPFSDTLNAGAIGLFAAAVLGSFAVMGAALAVSRPLVHAALRQP